MKLPRRKFLRLAGAAATLPILARPAFAQTYPTRPIRWIVPYPAGGATDLIARLIANWLQERLGQPVIIDNRPGGGTNIGTQVVVSAAPDGYTLLFTASTHTINASLQQLPFNFLRDITMVSGLAELPLVMNVARSFRPRRSPSSSPMRRPIRARSTSPRSARPPSATWRSSS
jgi:tripartite-type tricarboxylate transporter receptor subunit TctC